MSKFLDWAFHHKTPTWIGACVFITIFGIAAFYIVFVIHLFKIGQGFGGALAIAITFAAAWWRVIASYKAHRGGE